MTPEEAQEETRFLPFLTSTDVQGHNVTSYDPERRLAEQEIGNNQCPSEVTN